MTDLNEQFTALLIGPLIPEHEVKKAKLGRQHKYKESKVNIRSAKNQITKQNVNMIHLYLMIQTRFANYF